MKELVRTYAPWIFNTLKWAKYKIEDRIYREKKTSFGAKNPDKTIYIIRTMDAKTGLMCYFNNALGHIEYAKSKGWFPVVDMQNYPNTYLDPQLNKKANSWEYYFQQPTEVTLQEAYESKHVVLCDIAHTHTSAPRHLWYDLYANEAVATQYFDIVQHQMALSDEMRCEINEQYNAIFPKGEKVLGVVCRGTDLIGRSNHSKQPTVAELCALAEKIMEESGCSYLFLASDENKNIDLFREYFGAEKVLTNECLRFDSYQDAQKDALGEMHFERKDDARLKGKEYLTTLCLLAKCNCLLGSLVGGTVGAIGFNAGAYERIEIYDAGRY